MGLFRNDLAIDLGSTSCLVFVRDKGVLLNEPSVVAIKHDRGKRSVIAVGHEASAMIGKTPASIEVIKPLAEGVVGDLTVTEAMLRYFIKKAQPAFTFRKPKVIISIPAGVSEVEQRAVKDAAIAAGARRVYLIEEPVAAALGAGLPITGTKGSMVVNIGGGMTQIGVFALGEEVISQTLRVGGDALNKALTEFIAHRYDVQIGEQTAEDLKRGIGTAYIDGKVRGEMTMEVRGRDLLVGVPKPINLTSDVVRDGMIETLQQIANAVRKVLQGVPPELSADILDRGIVLTGGSSLLRNMDQFLRDQTGVPVFVSDEPIQTVVRGAAIALQYIKSLKKLTAT